MHGDGLANVIHSDGLANFSHPDYKGKLLSKDKDFPQENKQFDIIVSNPPYSVSAFKNSARSFYKDGDFDLYNRLTDNSSEIECLFIERTKQLLKDGGVAGIILPSSILSNTGIYSKSREIILQYFDIVGITELGSNTFMATGTNTVTLFLRRRNNYECANIKIAVEKFLTNFLDVTINGIEKPVTKYVNHVWENISFEDYTSLLKKAPNKAITEHEFYKEYQKKLKAKNDKEFWNLILDKELDKLYYFIIAYKQKVVLIKSGEKDAEKRFLGYEFSNRRGNEGIHAIQRGKNIEDCTQLFDAEFFDNPEKASTYIYKAFAGDYDFPIDEAMGNNVSRHNLIDMLTFDRVDFEKNISLSLKKKVKFESIWGTNKLEFLGEISDIKKGTSITKEKTKKGTIPVIAGGQEAAYYHNESNREGDVITVSASGAYAGFVNYYETPIFASDCNTIISKDESKISTKLIYIFLKSIQNEIYGLQRGQAQPHVYGDDLSSVKIPLPSLAIQQKIVSEIAALETNEKEANDKLNNLNYTIQAIINKTFSDYSLELLGDVCYSTEYGSSTKSEKKGLVPVIRMGNIQKGKILLDDLVYSNSVEENEKYLLKYNDVLFNRTNSPELVGKVGIYKSNEPAIFAGYLIRINYKENIVLPVYLNYVLNSETIRNYGFSVMSKSVNQANINGTILKSYRIPLPPISEQQKIVSEIEKIEVKINLLEKEIADIPKLKEAVLKKYL